MGWFRNHLNQRKLAPIPYLNCYKRDKITAKFLLIDRDNTKPEYLDHYINLDEFAKYLKDIEYIHKDEDLQNKNIYESPTVKPHRKVKGELLKIIVKRHDLGDYAYGEIFKKYQKK